MNRGTSIQRSEGLERLIREFENPSAEVTPMPVWFWNDTLTEDEISRQIHAFHEKGVDGFVIHPRLGLDPSIPYMGEEWLTFVRYAVSLARKLDMKVISTTRPCTPRAPAVGRWWPKIPPTEPWD